MTIDMETLREWLETGKNVTILDVRPARERAEWSIPGSLHIDAYDVLRAHDPHALDALELPREAPVVTVCAAGKTSLIAADLLRSRGHTVYSLVRGMKGWSAAWNTAEVAISPPHHGARVIQVRRTGKGCLSYLLGAGSEATVIDASVGIEVYQKIAQGLGWRITRVVETHVHADHLSRSRELAAATGAALLVPEQKRLKFAHVSVHDNDTISIGSSGASLIAMRTPGHTGESTCYALDGALLFTGDTLFLGSVGRPDLEAGRTEAEARARVLFASLRRILSHLARTVILPRPYGHARAIRRPPAAGLPGGGTSTDSASERIRGELRGLRRGAHSRRAAQPYAHHFQPMKAAFSRRVIPRSWKPGRTAARLPESAERRHAGAFCGASDSRKCSNVHFSAFA